MIKLDETGRILYVSPVLKGLFHKKEGEVASREEVLELAEKLVQGLETAAGLGEERELMVRLTTPQSASMRAPLEGAPLVISFSGGVADCIEEEKPWLAFGDMGPELGMAIRKSRLCRGEYMLGAETIRATVIGAGCHSAQLSGSTVFYQNVRFPLKNLPVVESVEALTRLDGPGVLVVAGEAMDFAGIRDLAKKFASQVEPPVYVAADRDMAKALGVQIALRLGDRAEILCIDRVRLKEGDYLDVGAPVGPAIQVVVKTLVLGS